MAWSLDVVSFYLLFLSQVQPRPNPNIFLFSLRTSQKVLDFLLVLFEDTDFHFSLPFIGCHLLNTLDQNDVVALFSFGSLLLEEYRINLPSDKTKMKPVMIS